MSGRKMRSRQTNAHNQKYKRYAAEKRREKNKVKRAERHGRKIKLQLELSYDRKELLKQILDKKRISKHVLRNLIGTFNSRKLQSVLNETYYTEKWYLERHKKEESGEKKNKPLMKIRAVLKTDKKKKKIKKD